MGCSNQVSLAVAPLPEADVPTTLPWNGVVFCSHCSGATITKDKFRHFNAIDGLIQTLLEIDLRWFLKIVPSYVTARLSPCPSQASKLNIEGSLRGLLIYPSRATIQIPVLVGLALTG
ncbi:hypothetical protein FNV43_RR09832 [Rhamnella rubrinervis]|uniref:Uncharacterized protein n=1 Tax=Rhamnella rubrinervis TaxID=2594499 RepID=A0A8K0MKK2_9ROSA|nr:hypothetical protein FNV43_RR09832 [Rhamnella rubrinervis]